MVDGSRRERELVHILDGDDERAPKPYRGIYPDDAFAVMRAPSSGAGTQRELPDVLAANGEDSYAIEAKASAERPIYIPKREIEDLEYFATCFGCTPKIGARFNRERWAFFDADDLHDAGKSLRVKIEDIPDGMDAKDLWTKS